MSNKSKAKQKGSFGNKSKYQKSLERQVELRKQIAEFEEKQKKDANEKSVEKTAEKKSEAENVNTSTK